MKLLSTLVIVAAALASGAAGAAQYGSDQERRDQNREEALARWRADHGTAADSSGRLADERTSLREKTKEGARSVRNFTHRQAEKARDFSARQDRRYGTHHSTTDTSPVGGAK